MDDTANLATWSFQKRVSLVSVFLNSSRFYCLATFLRYVSFTTKVIGAESVTVIDCS